MSRFWAVRCNAIDARAAWPLALPLLAPAIAESQGCFEPEDVEALVTRPNAGTQDGWSLWLLGEKDTLLAAWTTKIEFYPRCRILLTVFGGGGGKIDEWWDFAIAEMDKFAAEVGCQRLRCMGRRGWGRGKGYATIGFVHERIPA